MFKIACYAIVDEAGKIVNPVQVDHDRVVLCTQVEDVETQRMALHRGNRKVRIVPVLVEAAVISTQLAPPVTQG